MGQQASVFIRTDKPGYTAGEAVTGTLYINVTEPFKCNGVFLNLKAEERAWMHRRIEKTRTVGEGEDQRIERYYEDCDYSNSGIIFQANQNVMQVGGDGTLPVGQYEVPFQFNLPETLPGSFYEEKFSWGQQPRNGDYYAEIVYSLNCLIDVAGFMSRDIRSTSYIQVNPTAPDYLEAAFVEQTKTVYSCCCFPQGDIYMATYPNEAVYRPGDRIKLNLEIDNRSEQRVKKVDVKLLRKIKLHLRGPYDRIEHLRNNAGPFSSDYGDPYNRRAFNNYAIHGYTHHQTVTMCQASFEGLEPGQSAIKDQARSLFLDLYANGRDFESETKGKVIECSYEIDVVADCESMIASDIHMKVPTRILPDTSRPPSAACYQMVQPTAPPGWNPVVQPKIEVNLNF